MNGSAYRFGAIIITWEATSAIALVFAALYFVPRYLKMGLTTIPEFLERRFDGLTRTLVALLLIISFVATLLPIVLYTGALNIESIFNVSDLMGVSKSQGLWATILIVGILGAIYAIYGGLKMVAYTDTINGFGLLIAGLTVPLIALYSIGNGNIINGLVTVFNHAPEKFRVISSEASIGPGSRDAILPFSVLFYRNDHQSTLFLDDASIYSPASLRSGKSERSTKGITSGWTIQIVNAAYYHFTWHHWFYYFGASLYDQQDTVYPELVKRVLPFWLTGFFVAVIMGAVLSTFNSALNSAATIFSLGIYKRYINKKVSEGGIVKIGRSVSLVLAIFAIGVAPFVASAPEGLYQLLQQLNGIFFIPMATVIIAAFFFPKFQLLELKLDLPLVWPFTSSSTLS